MAIRSVEKDWFYEIAYGSTSHRKQVTNQEGKKTIANRQNKKWAPRWNKMQKMSRPKKR